MLDQAFLVRLGSFDVVYSGGVASHGSHVAGAVNVTPLVKPEGRLYIAIYNDQGRASVLWKRVKRAYCRTPGPVRRLILGLALVRLWGPTTVRDFYGTPRQDLAQLRQGSGRVGSWHVSLAGCGGLGRGTSLRGGQARANLRFLSRSWFFPFSARPVRVVMGAMSLYLPEIMIEGS